jgi:undecaprenyl diphosphate synthase
MMENKIKKIIPEHIAIVMDGNRRWAKERNLSTLEGHLRGYNKLKQAPEWFFAQGVKIVTLFAFSTENWQRSQDEVNYLMKLTEKAFADDLEEFNAKGYKLLLSGRISELPGNLPEICSQAVLKTGTNTRGILHICLNYGGRAEIIDSVKKMMLNKLEIEQVHDGIMRKYLYQPDLSDPDMIIRTSGEQRLSNFLMWQSAYAELYFMQKYWPDFEQSDVDKIIDEYNNRQRRFGE